MKYGAVFKKTGPMLCPTCPLIHFDKHLARLPRRQNAERPTPQMPPMN